MDDDRFDALLFGLMIAVVLFVAFLMIGCGTVSECVCSAVAGEECMAEAECAQGANVEPKPTSGQDDKKEGKRK